MMLYNPDSLSFELEDELVTEPIIVNGKNTYELCLTMAYYVTGDMPPGFSTIRTITVSAESLVSDNIDQFIVQLSDANLNNAYNPWNRVSVTMTDISEPFQASTM